MEHQTAHRAADTISELLLAHISEEPSDVDIHDALAVRDDVRELAEELESDDTRGYELPEVGDRMHDPESNSRFGSGYVRITEVKENSRAKTTYFETAHGRKSVAHANPSHPEDAPVVVGTYVNGSNKEYHFPVTRLE